MIKKALLITGFMTAAAAASAADGCKFLLCMGAANPMGISECAPTVKEVLHDLSRGKSLPKCKLENGEDSETTGNYVAFYKAKVPTCPVGYATYGKALVKYHRGKPNNADKAAPVINGGITLSKNSNVCLKGDVNGRVKPRGEYYTHEWYDDVVKTYKDGKKYEFATFFDGQLQSKHRF